MKVSESELRTLQQKVNGGRPLQPSTSCPRSVPPVKVMDARSPFRSKLERSYADYLHTMMVCGEIKLYRYEPQTFNLGPGVRYTPDFWVRLKDGKEEWHEVKGYAKSLLSRAGMVKVKIAVSQWPWLKFVLVTRQRGIWNQQEL